MSTLRVASSHNKGSTPRTAVNKRTNETVSSSAIGTRVTGALSVALSRARATPAVAVATTAIAATSRSHKRFGISGACCQAPRPRCA
jgi:hypothetical protein